MKKYLVEYSSNNSGGDWWLKDKDWYALEKAGWMVVWANKTFDYLHCNSQYDKNGFPKLKDEGNGFAQKDKQGKYRWLGALAKYAYKHFDTITEALQEFEKITKQNVSDEGCNCCGAPHCFCWSDAKTHKPIGYISGENCLKYLYEYVPKDLREATIKLNERSKK